jgi:tetratricopeptide (TPR) repeat protein
VAFTAFSVVDAGDPEARADWTAPFAAGPASDKKYSAQEHTAHFLRRQGRLREAAAAYERALHGRTADPTYLFYGMTLLAIDRRSDAKRVFQACVSRTASGILGTRVRDVCRRGLTYLDESLVLSPSAADAGRRARADGRIADAIETYRKAIAAEPDSLHAHYWLAMIYGLAERRDELRSHLDRAVSLAGDSPDGRFLRILRPYL